MEEYETSNIKAFVRVRPPLQRELDSKKSVPILKISPNSKEISVHEYYGYDFLKPDNLQELESNHYVHQFSFDFIYDQKSSQQFVYEHSTKPSIPSIFNGFNTTIMAYGQTGTGKTFTMEGPFSEQSKGLLPRSADEIFKYIAENKDLQTNFSIKISYLQIYNEMIQDLLNEKANNLHIREDKRKGIFVEGISEWSVRTTDELLGFIKKGSQMRTTGATKMNDLSSRSHAIFIINIQKTTVKINENQQKLIENTNGKLNFVDLAGSERVRMSGATGKRLEETKKINQSLSALGNVISALTDNNRNKSHIPFRDSKLTRILEDSLAGNSRTILITMISPFIENFFETLCSLKFASRAKNLKQSVYPHQMIQIEEITPKEQPFKNKNEEKSDSKAIIQNQIEGKNQTEIYKEIIMKQRDIMVELTEKIQEKEDDLQRMRKEINTFDKIHQEMKEALNKSNTRTQILEQELKKKNNQINNNTSKLCQENDMNTFNCEKTERNKAKKKNGKTVPQIIEIKKIIDQVICDLSKPNEQSKLQDVADNLLRLQKNVDKLLISKQKDNENNVNSPLNNITNITRASANPIPIKKILQSKKFKESISLDTKENIFNIIPLRGDVNLSELMEY